MKELRTIVQAYQTIDFSRTRAALATVVRVEGSSYRRTGARMLVLDNGTYLGGISGGCLEGDALRRAQKGILLNRPSVITYDTTQDDDHQVGVGLGCNGIIDVLFTPLDPSVAGNPVRVLSGLTGIREPAFIVAVTGGAEALGATLLYEDDPQFLQYFPIPALAEAVLRDLQGCRAALQSRTVDYGEGGKTVRIFIEVVLPAIHVVAYGSNNDIYPFLQLAGNLGWDTTIVTKTVKADKALFALATRVLDQQEEARPQVDAYTAEVLMTHDYATDLRLLQGALLTPASYIGLLGPRKRAERMYTDLSLQGCIISDPDQQRIYAPAGLDIGASTPEEIALSILAEIRSHFAARQGASLRLRDGTIYGNG